MAAALSAKPTVPIGAPPSPGCDGGAPAPPGSDIGARAPLDHDIDSPPLLVVGWWHPFVSGDGYVGTAQDAVKIRRLEKQREAERCKIEELKNKSADGQPGLLQFGSSTSENLPKFRAHRRELKRRTASYHSTRKRWRR